MNNPAYVIDFDRKLDSQKNGKTPTEPPATPFEEAVTLTGIGKFHYMLLLVCGVCFMSVMVEIMGVGIIMPSMKCDLPSTVGEQGVLASAGFLGIVMSSHAMGFFADTWGRARTLRLALVMSTIATVISSFSVNIWMLIVFRVMNGFFIGGGQACVFSMCGEFHGNKTRVRHVTLLSGFLPLALMYLPAMAIVILPLRIETLIFGLKFTSWRVLLLVNSSLSMLALGGLFMLPETPKYKLVQGDHDGALEILRTIYAKNTGRSRDEFPVKRIVLEYGGASLTDIHGVKDAVKMVWSQTVPLFNKERCLHTINICCILFVVYGISQGIFMWFPTILNEMLLRSDEGNKVCHIITHMETAADLSGSICAGDYDIFMFQVLIMIGAVFFTFYLIFAYTIDYMGKKNLLMGWLAVSALCLLAVHWTSNFSISVVVLTLIMSVGNCGGIVNTIAMEFYPTHINGMGMCFIMMIGRLGAVAGSNIMGQLLFSSCDTVFWVIMGVVGVLCGLAYYLPERKTSKTPKT